MAMLEVKDLNVYYGAIHAIKNISFEVINLQKYERGILHQA